MAKKDRVNISSYIDAHEGLAIAVLAIAGVSMALFLIKVLFDISVGWPAVALMYGSIPFAVALLAVFFVLPVEAWKHFISERKAGAPLLKTAAASIGATAAGVLLMAIVFFAMIAAPMQDIPSLFNPACDTISDLSWNTRRGRSSRSYSVEGTTEDGRELTLSVSRAMRHGMLDVRELRVTYLPHSGTIIEFETVR